MKSLFRRRLCVALLSLSLQTPLYAHRGDAEMSAASSLSLALPIAVSATAPALVLSGGAMLSLVAVHVVAEGTVWVLERASDGVRISVAFAAGAIVAGSLAVGAAVNAVAISAGWLLLVGSEVLAFVPNELGRALTYHERMTP